MGSGYLPITDKEDKANALEAIKTLQFLCAEYYEVAYGAYEQFDNSFFDGMYISDFLDGLKKITGCFQFTEEEVEEIKQAQKRGRSEGCV